MNTFCNSQKSAQRILRKHESGVVLMVALIALVALTLAGIALLRSVDTGNLIAGNMAFRQAALLSSDMGVEAAFINLPSYNKNANKANEYYAIRKAVDVMGVPNGIDWSSVPCRDYSGAKPACSTQDYQVKYVVDRLCSEQTSGSTSVTNYQTYCMVDVGSGKGCSKGSFSPCFSSVDAVYYRVTVQVTGPKNTRAYSQAILSTGI